MTYKQRIHATTDAQAAFAKAVIERQAREARRAVRDAKRIGLAGNIPGFKQSVRWKV